MEWKTRRLSSFLNKTPLFYCFAIFFFFLFSAFALLMSSNISTEPTPCLDIRCQMSNKIEMFIQEVEMILSQIKEEMVISDGEREVPPSMTRTRRLLSVPGSWPPRCASKCGKCIPCKPVHVTVPPGKLVSPGTPVTTEYYPEAWRCKCGNKLYMP